MMIMILTLSHFENQLHSSCYAHTSSHAINALFGAIRGSYRKEVEKAEQH